MSNITVTNLHKSYGDVDALEDVSFEILDGEFVVILGESGAGKSTLLRCLNGLTEPTTGSVKIDGEPVNGPRDDVGMIFQQHNIIEEMTAYTNALSGSLNRTSLVRSLFQWNDREEKLDALRALDTVGLLDDAEQRAGRMSGGQQQRVGISRALVQDPNLLLADEPVASLDPASAESVMGYIKDAADQHDLTTLASLHQVNLAREFGQRFIGMKDGRVIFDGYRDDLTFDVIDDIYGNIQTDAIRTGDDEDDANADVAPTTSSDGGTDAAGGPDQQPASDPHLS
ncbi:MULTISPECIES: phosphonate ABC transporter ATP-binding protein [Halobacterium]|uniref:phosphonate ABC transporter ATP-binding protein n=1 Tax=Halobacterium TaxID=2239 RepID=UPI001962F57F|nr:MULTISPECIES: phosphonate ABC transporter ATP-binding protein [Halobacterium]MCF2206563.1 phosphonate ABC transporter ATP-binding protein [Halobacterium salinarum]MCF2239576.1 phosphonate ABC transporter ATP-binding protein [Halobacterium salinarum]MDL0123196.1 phosphonate ABC transporter ATP-binding protein [Halobacterium salinarum]MDL0133855.1 phosphonate ABC transporter ATP-binding protein [Halobacterium salinarum]MDL0136624.1 phosphonate ABC transporter ATP-binding protein [Halobacteriu